MSLRAAVSWTLAGLYGVLAVGVLWASLVGNPQTTAAPAYLLALSAPWSLLVLLVVVVLGIGPSSTTLAVVSLGLVLNLALLVSLALRATRRGVPSAG